MGCGNNAEHAADRKPGKQDALPFANTFKTAELQRRKWRSVDLEHREIGPGVNGNLPRFANLRFPFWHRNRDYERFATFAVEYCWQRVGVSRDERSIAHGEARGAELKCGHPRPLEGSDGNDRAFDAFDGADRVICQRRGTYEEY